MFKPKLKGKKNDVAFVFRSNIKITINLTEIWHMYNN